METDKNVDKIESPLPDDKSDACASDDDYPAETTRLDCQVAGHPFDPKKNKIGMLRGKNGEVLKSGEKPILQEREIAFYEAIKNFNDPIYKELSAFVPKYFGTLETTYKNKPIKFLVLKDLTEGMKKPCVMDVKIGKRTWDPLAGPEKIEADERKYTASKTAYGFYIPGFQVYNVTSGELRKFNKDYTKKLDAAGVVDSLRMFLNAEPGERPNRELVVNLLSYLWKILAFFRVQKRFRFYASSLLIVYDMERLRSILRGDTNGKYVCGIDTRGKTFSSSGDAGRVSGQFTSNGSAGANSPPSRLLARMNRVRAIDRLCRLKRSTSLTGDEFPGNSNSGAADSTIERSNSFGRGLDENFCSLCRTHSSTNNYDRDMVEIKEDYARLLENLTGKSRACQDWLRVNMIDFTHVFDAEEPSTDANYLEGIENLIKILESFLG